jgi:hypothetical protein
MPCEEGGDAAVSEIAHHFRKGSDASPGCVVKTGQALWGDEGQEEKRHFRSTSVVRVGGGSGGAGMRSWVDWRPLALNSDSDSDSDSGAGLDPRPCFALTLVLSAGGR